MHHIPKHLDKPKLWLFFSLDEFLAFIIPLVMGFIGDFIGKAFLFSVTFVFLLRYWKGRNSHWNFKIVLYWYLPINLKSTPPSWVKKYWS